MSALNIQEIEKTHGAVMASKLEKACQLFQQHFESASLSDVTVAVAPGRVNLIGEHTDYTGGFVLPFAIEYSCVVYGQGKLTTTTTTTDDNGPTKASLSFVSAQGSQELVQLEITSESQPPEKPSWTSYVCGTVFQYLADLPKSSHLELSFAMASDVPLGSGLSSSASLEVSVARFVEAIIGDYAFSSSSSSSSAKESNHAKVRALRCQKAENTWCNSPCGIMDQYISSAATAGGLLMIDCTSLESHQTLMAETNRPVLVVANSNVQHDIGGGEYPIRVQQCKTATAALQKVNPQIQTLRQATLEDVEQAKEHMDDVSYKRAKHVVTENARVAKAKAALEEGDWKEVGSLMNQSHTSMRDDYEVSCEEVDMLVEIAQKQPGVFGSRLTGGGFGGCTVTLVEASQAESLMETLRKEYKAKTGKDCNPFQTQPAQGAHILTL